MCAEWGAQQPQLLSLCTHTTSLPPGEGSAPTQAGESQRIGFLLCHVKDLRLPHAPSLQQASSKPKYCLPTETKRNRAGVWRGECETEPNQLPLPQGGNPPHPSRLTVLSPQTNLILRPKKKQKPKAPQRSPKSINLSQIMQRNCSPQPPSPNPIQTCRLGRMMILSPLL